MLQNFSEKLRGKFPLSTLSLSMVSISCLVKAFSEIPPLERSLVEGQQLQQKDKTKRKRKSGKKIKKRKVVRWFILQKLSQNFDLCACPSKNLVQHYSSERQVRVLRCKGHFEWFEAILANNSPLNVKNVSKMHFFGKNPGVNGLSSNKQINNLPDVEKFLYSFIVMFISRIHRIYEQWQLL